MRKMNDLENACSSDREQGRAGGGGGDLKSHPNTNLMSRLDSTTWREANAAEFSRRTLIE